MLNNNGFIDKYIGDAVLAVFGIRGFLLIVGHATISQLTLIERQHAILISLAVAHPDSLAVVAILIYGLVQTIVGLGVAFALSNVR